MLDMFRVPLKLIAAMEKLVSLLVKTATDQARKSGNPKEVKDYVKMLIDVVGEGGGLMVDCGVWFDEAKNENVKVMVDFAKAYGVYTKEG